MVVIEGFIRIVLVVFLGVVSFDCFNAHGRDCYDVGNKTVCYFRPNKNYIELTWDDAWKVCKENDSTLPVIENQLIAGIFRRHLQKSDIQLPTEMWLAGRDIRTNVWQWLNGKHFGQQNLLGSRDTLKSSYETNAVITGRLQYKLNYAAFTGYYICHYNVIELCQNKSVILWKNGCLFVNDDERLNLVDARNRCLDEKGDLATFEEDEDLEMLRKYSSLLNGQRQYWIGLRLNWWIWNETDSSKEIKYSNWTKYENRPNEECLCIRFYNNKWNQHHCTAKKPFICQTVTTTGNRPGADNLDARHDNVNAPQSNFVVFLVAGVSILVVTIILVVVIAAVIVKRKTRRQLNDSMRVHTDGLYEDLHHEQDKLRSSAQYMELQVIAHQGKAINPNDQNVCDYEEVVVARRP